MKIIKAQSKFRTRWDKLILVLIVISIIIVPIQVAFQHQVSVFGSFFIYAIDVFFIVDIFFNTKTSFRIAGVEIVSKQVLLKQYSKSGLKLDLLASLPFDALFLFIPGLEFEGISIIIWLRLLRLLRLKKMFTILNRWQSNKWINPGYLRIAKFFSGMLFLSHFISCAWYLSAFLSKFPAKSWVVINEIQQSDLATKYIRSLYWTVTTMTTVGYGDITPHLNYEYVFAIIVMIIGAAMYAFIIGNIASLISTLDVQKASYLNKIDAVKLYLKHRGVPVDLNERVRNYYEYRWENHRGLEEQKICNDLPDPLRLEVMMQLTKGLLEKVPLFKYSSIHLKNVLLLALKAKTFDPNSFVVRSGEVSKEIFFVSKGSLDIIDESNEHIYSSLTEGDYFGNLSIILGEKRTASAKTNMFCEMFVLNAEDFFRIKSEYPEFMEVMKKMSLEKTEKTMKLILEGVVI